LLKTRTGAEKQITAKNLGGTTSIRDSQMREKVLCRERRTKKGYKGSANERRGVFTKAGKTGLSQKLSGESGTDQGPQNAGRGLGHAMRILGIVCVPGYIKARSIAVADGKKSKEGGRKYHR